MDKDYIKTSQYPGTVWAEEALMPSRSLERFEITTDLIHNSLYLPAIIYKTTLAVF
ncbi:TPA: hypothetical protein I9553_001882 [Legionella pneumophila]|nr:hypothetical protein [Legionella pneumophila]